jgi:GrpB-like predicted nucleotidyltransferase (UPF0157 family)
MMENYSYYDLAKRKYVDASLQMLDHFRTNVIEVHHIGSSSFTSLNMPEDIDVLVILKTQNQVAELPDVLIAEGYEIIKNFSPYYINETIVRGKSDDVYVNFIFMADGEPRKQEILKCKTYINENNECLEEFIHLKKQYHHASLSEEKYQEKKEAFFSGIVLDEDINVV